MTGRKISIALLATISTFTFVACSSSRNGSPGSGRVYHVVLCWLKDSGSADARRQLIDASYKLQSIPGVLEVHAGSAFPSERPIVDDSFDVGIVFVLKDREALAAYLENPTHKQVVATVLKPLAARVLIYDIQE